MRARSRTVSVTHRKNGRGDRGRTDNHLLPKSSHSGVSLPLSRGPMRFETRLVPISKRIGTGSPERRFVRSCLSTPVTHAVAVVSSMSWGRHSRLGSAKTASRLFSFQAFSSAITISPGTTEEDATPPGTLTEGNGGGPGSLPYAE